MSVLYDFVKEFSYGTKYLFVCLFAYSIACLLACFKAGFLWVAWAILKLALLTRTNAKGRKGLKGMLLA